MHTTGTLTFSGRALHCVNAGTHMCSSGEMRGIMGSGVALSTGVALDWMDAQGSVGNAMYVISGGTAAAPEGERATTTASYCRCCQNVE